MSRAERIDGQRAPPAQPPWHVVKPVEQQGQVVVFQPLPAGMMALHKRIKLALDPAGILNPARLYIAL